MSAVRTKLSFAGSSFIGEPYTAYSSIQSKPSHIARTLFWCGSVNDMLDMIYIVGGFFGLLVGGNLLVQGAVSLARRLGISPMIIGLTLVGFGTSMPELVTSA